MEKTALITGAGSGIGRGMALALARRGYHLFLAGRDAARLQGLTREIEPFAAVSLYRTDLADPSARSRFIDSVLADAGGAPSLLVNNAAQMPAGIFLHQSAADLEAVFSTNLLAPAELCQRFCQFVLPPQGVIFILSTAARFPQPYNSLYTASKTALRSLAECLQVEFHGQIRVCLAYPPLTDTPMTAGFPSPGGPFRKADALQVGERIIAGYEAGRDEIAWFDWEIIPGLLYRLAPRLFRKLLQSQRKRLQETLRRE